MKLFGGKKKNRAVREDIEDVTSAREETKILRINMDVMREKLIGKGWLKTRPMKIALWGLVCVLILAAAFSLCIKLAEKTGEAEPEHSISVENTENADGKMTASEDLVIVLPLSPAEPIEIPEQETESDVSHNEAEESVRKNDCYTFLFAVYDSKGINVDTIMVSRLDIAEASLNVVSIPRDTLVNVSWDLKRINTVMAREEGDARRFLNEISGIVGFPIDYYAFINGDTVEKMVDAIGGVYYTVPRNMYYDAANIRVSAGYQWLNGSKAVQVLSFRMGNDGSGYSNGELGRIDTMHDFIRGLLYQFLDKGEIPSLDELIRIFAENSAGNLDEEKLRLFADEFMKLDEQDVQFATLPGKNVSIRNTYYYEIDPVEWAELINKRLNPYSQEMALHNLDILMYDSSAKTVMSTSGEMIALDSFY